MRRLPRDPEDGMDERTRRRLGWAALVVGSAVMAFGVLVVHFTELAELDEFGREQWAWVPRGWYWVILGKSVAFLGSQIALGGIVVGWLLYQPMTWARATVGAAVFTLQILLWFGVVPNEWLGLTQGEFEWTSQKEAFAVPKILVLNNDVTISFAAIKDAVNGGYNAALLGALLVGMYKWQEYSKKGPAERPQPVSTYGRPIVKGSR